MSNKTGSKLETLSKGATIGEWKVNKKLGSGTFGAVYLVTHAKTKEERAMKIEAMELDEDSMLLMEIAVLTRFRRSPVPHPHICDYADSGETKTLRYLVMKLAGPNLGDVRKRCPKSRFTESTTIRLGIQCVQSLESLHQVGFVHRDVKPPNFAIGVGSSRRMVYLLDFGLSRQYVDRHGQLRRPRQKVGFRGTVRYASVNAHFKRDLGRHDDLWSLLYMLIELRTGQLPWRNIFNRHQVAEAKRDIVADDLLKGMAKEFHQFANELYGLQFSDTPNYKYLCDQLEAAMTRTKVRFGDQYDWEKIGDRKKCFNIKNPFKRRKQKKEQQQSRKERGEEEKSRLSV